MKIELHDTRGQLLTNIKHFNDGHSIENMPIVFESIEVSCNESPNNDIEETIKEESTPPNAEPLEEIMADVEEIEIKPLKRSLPSRMWEWATTPTDRSWSDINKDTKK